MVLSSHRFCPYYTTIFNEFHIADQSDDDDPQHPAFALYVDESDTESVTLSTCTYPTPTDSSSDTSTGEAITMDGMPPPPRPPPSGHARNTKQQHHNN